MAELGVAWISVVPDTSKIAPGVRKAFGQADRDAGRAGKNAGSSFARSAASMARRWGPAIAAGFVIKGGLSRLLQIDDARAKLKGMGLEAREIAQVQASVDKAVTGTAFSLADGMNAATTAMASGVKAGSDLEKYLRLIGDVATQGGASYQEMASIINQVQARGKVGQENLNRLTERGIGIQSMLAKHYGVTGEELQGMLRRGEVSVKDFQTVLEDNFAGSAQAAGDTVRGSFANMRTSLSRLGAAILEPAFAQAPAIFQGVTAAVKDLSAEGGPVQRAGEAIGAGLKSLIDGAGSAMDFFGGFTLDADEFDGEEFGTRLSEGILTGLRKLGGMAADLGSMIGGWAKKVDWVGLGIEFGKAAVPLVVGLVLGIVNFDIGGLFKGLVNNWQAVLIGALTLIFAPAKLLSPIAKAVNKIPLVGPLVTWLAKGFRRGGRAVFGFVGAMFRSMWEGFKAGMGWIGPSFIGRFLGWMAGLWPRLKTWADGLTTNLFATLFGGLTRIGQAIGGVFRFWLTNLRVVFSAAFQAIGAVVQFWWTNAKIVFFAARSFVTGVLAPVFSWLWRSVIAPAFQGIGIIIRTSWTVIKAIFTAIRWFISSVLAPIFTWLWRTIIRPVFGAIGGYIRTTWGVIRPVFGLLRSGVSRVGGAFSAAVGLIRRGWDKLGGIVKRPIDAAIRIINGFLKLINKIPGVEIPLILSSAKSAPKGVSRGALMRRATGGAVFGPGSGTSDSILARLSNNEHVWTAREVAALGGHDKMMALRAAVLNGQFHLPGYAAGGGVIGAPLSNPHSRAQYPWATFAGDFAAPMGTAVRAWKSGVIALVRSMATSYGKHIRMNHGDGTSSLYAHLSSFAAKMGQRVNQGQMIGRVGSTGNALDVDTPVLTQNRGWVRHGDLIVGDVVYDESGEPTNVTHVAHWSDRSTYRVTFDDGTTIDADENHLWGVYDYKEKRRGNAGLVVTDTKTMAASAVFGKTKAYTRYSVPVAGAVEHEAKSYRIDPYALGVWLGNGHAANSRISFGCDNVDEMRRHLEDVGETSRLSPDTGGNWRLTLIGDRVPEGAYNDRTGTNQHPEAFSMRLRDLGLIGHKHIPAEYMTGSIEQRRALLAGLLDTDGYVDDRQGTVEFVQASDEHEHLARQVLELALGLGFKATLCEGDATLNGRRTSTKYRVCFTPDTQVFRLKRKAERVALAIERRTERSRTRLHRRFIQSVERIDSRDTNCITVDGPSHLYIAGREMVPTHNSTGPHLHLELMGGHYKGGGGKGLIASIWDSIKGAGGKITGWIKSKLLDKANIGGLFGNVTGLFKRIGNGVKDWALDKLFDGGGIASGRGLMVKNTLQPERVLSPSSTRALNEGLRNLGPAAGVHERPIVVDGTTFARLVENLATGAAEIVVGDYRAMDGQLTRMGAR